MLLFAVMRLSLNKLAKTPVVRLLLVACIALAPALWNSFCPPDVASEIVVQPLADTHESSDSHYHDKSHDSASHESSSSQDSDGCCSYKPDATHAVLQKVSVSSPQLIRSISFLIADGPISLTTAKLSSSNTYLHYGGRLASSLASIPLYQSLSHYLI